MSIPLNLILAGSGGMLRFFGGAIDPGSYEVASLLVWTGGDVWNPTFSPTRIEAGNITAGGGKLLYSASTGNLKFHSGTGRLLCESPNQTVSYSVPIHAGGTNVVTIKINSPNGMTQGIEDVTLHGSGLNEAQDLGSWRVSMNHYMVPEETVVTFLTAVKSGFSPVGTYAVDYLNTVEQENYQWVTAPIITIATVP